MSSSKGKKKGFVEWLFCTIPGKTVVGYCNGIGAAIVIVGAMFKIMHWPGASAMLIIGLSTEALLFLMGALEPQHLPYHWESVYPQLAHSDDEEEEGEHAEGEEHGHGHEAHDLPAADKAALGHGHAPAAHGAHVGQVHTLTVSPTIMLDSILKEGQLEPELIASLGDSFRALKEQTEKITDLTQATVVTGEYVQSVKNASQSMDKLSETYVRASESLTGLSMTSEDGATYGEQLQNVSKKLAELNAVYDLQLRGSSEHLKATSQFYEGLDELLKNLSDSVEDTRQYKQNIGELSKNLSALNTVYGNMLSAMNFQNRG